MKEWHGTRNMCDVVLLLSGNQLNVSCTRVAGMENWDWAVLNGW